MNFNDLVDNKIREFTQFKRADVKFMKKRHYI